tara:strand:+ start:6415 stop:6684 length:270 start_codon:yes stop_codon:yes gene_type:complete
MKTAIHGLTVYGKLRVNPRDMPIGYKWCYEYADCPDWVNAGYKPFSGKYIEPYYKMTKRFFKYKHGHKVGADITKGGLFPYELMDIFSI